MVRFVRHGIVVLLLSAFIASCGGKANVQYPDVGDTSFQVRTFKLEKHRYNAVGSRTVRGTEGMTDPAGETRRIMEAIENTMAGICAPRTAILRGQEVEAMVIAVNTLYDCVAEDG